MRSRSAGEDMRRVFGRLHWVVVGILAAVAGLPLLYMLLIALTPNTDVAVGQVYPSTLSFENFGSVWSAIPLAHDMLNSLIVSVSAAVLATAVGLGLAYPISRANFRGRQALLASLVSLQAVPQVIILLPLFIVIAGIQSVLSVTLIGQYYVLIGVYLTFGIPLSSWLLFTYLSSLPRDIEEAGACDGCTQRQVLWHIVVPLLKPGLIVSFLFALLTAWSDVLFASVLTSNSTRTVAVGLQAFLGGQSGNAFWGSLMAASLINGAIIATLFLMCQRFFVRGLTAGAVTG